MLNTGNLNCFNSLFIVDTLNSILLHPISFSLHLQDQYYLLALYFIDKNHSGFVGAPSHLPATWSFPIIPLFLFDTNQQAAYNSQLKQTTDI